MESLRSRWYLESFEPEYVPAHHQKAVFRGNKSLGLGLSLVWCFCLVQNIIIQLSFPFLTGSAHTPTAGSHTHCWLSRRSLSVLTLVASTRCAHCSVDVIKLFNVPPSPYESLVNDVGVKHHGGADANLQGMVLAIDSVRIQKKCGQPLMDFCVRSNCIQHMR